MGMGDSRVGRFIGSARISSTIETGSTTISTSFLTNLNARFEDYSASATGDTIPCKDVCPRVAFIYDSC